MNLLKMGLIIDGDPRILANEFIAPLYMIRIEYMADNEEGSLDEILEMVYNHVDFFYESVRID